MRFAFMSMIFDTIDTVSSLEEAWQSKESISRSRDWHLDLIT